MNGEILLSELVECVETAIRAGDWKVDGACDPDSIIYQSKRYLEFKGWKRNGVDGSLMPPPF